MPVKMANSTQMNTRFVVGLLAIIGVSVYCIYSAWNSGSKTLEKDASGNVKGNSKTFKTFKTWKSREFDNIPAAVMEAAKNIPVAEHHLEFTPRNGEKVNIFFRESGPKESKLQVLLLHGAAFSSQTWKDIKTLQLIGAFGYRVVAVDLPGKGNSGGVKSPKAKDEFLASFMKQEHLGRPVVVAPSMSGSYAIPYLLMDGPERCTERMSGFIPVAPAFASSVKSETFAKCQVPAMIVYGTKDKGAVSVSHGTLHAMPNSEVIPLKDASHPAYMDKTDEWHKLLYNFLKLVESDL